MGRSTIKIAKSFRESLSAQLAPLVRYIRESISAKRVPHKVVKFQIGTDKVSLDLVEGQLRVSISNKRKTKILEPELPKLFVKHVKLYVSNMGWTMDSIQSTHADSGGVFFSVPREIVENSLVCGWRAVTFVTNSLGKFNVHAFHPMFYGIIETIDSKIDEGQAKRLSEYLAYGQCFDCSMKRGPQNFCFRHDHVK